MSRKALGNDEEMSMKAYRNDRVSVAGRKTAGFDRFMDILREACMHTNRR